MKFAKGLIFVPLIVFLLLAAELFPGLAGRTLAGSDPEPSVTPSTADWVDFVDGSRLFSIRHPQGWSVSKTEIIALSPGDRTNVDFSVLPHAPVLAIIPQSLVGVDSSDSPEALQFWIDALRVNWDDATIDVEPGPLIAGQPTSMAHVVGTDHRTGIAFEMNLITLSMTEDEGLIIAITPQSLWNDAWPTMEAALKTLQLLQPDEVDSVTSVTDPTSLIWHDLHLGQEAENAQPIDPQAIAAGPLGELYVLDGDADQIEIYSPQGILLSTLGQPGNEPGQFDFSPPGRLTVDGEGNVYVVDPGNGRIQKFDSKGEVQLIGANVLNAPRDVAVSTGGAIFVTDAESRQVQVFDRQGQPTRQLNLKTEEGLDEIPQGIAIGSEGDIYVTVPAAQSILVLDSSGQVQRTMGRQSSEASTVAWPVDVVVDSDGDIFVADPELGQVKQFSAQGQLLASFGQRELGEPIRPSSLALGPDGNLYVTDEEGGRVLRFVLQDSEMANLQISNGNFEFGLAGWKPLTPQTQMMDTGQALAYDTDESHGQVLELKKTDQSGETGTVGVLQPLDLSVTGVDALYLTAEVKIITEEGDNIGGADSDQPIEGAVLFRVFYKDVEGNQGQWYHGFYSQNVPDSDATHFTTVPLEMWHTYRSENLVEEFPKMDTITGLQIYGVGRAFVSQIDDVQFRTN